MVVRDAVRLLEPARPIAAGGTGGYLSGVVERTGSGRKFWIALCALLMAVLLAGCSSGGDASTQSGGDAGTQSGGEASTQSGGEAFPAQDQAELSLPMEDGNDVGGDQERLVIRTKTLRLEVEDTPAAMDKVKDLTRSHSGTVSHMEVATDSEEWLYRYDESGTTTALRGWLTVKIPTADYEAFVEEVSAVGDVKFQAEAASDVTQEYVDLSARLENLRAQEVRLREFFDAAVDVEDMLAIETELARVRGEIESMDAQVTYLERETATASITIELTEPQAVVRPEGESWGFVDALTSGVRGAVGVVTTLLTLAIAASPLLLLGGLGFLVVRGVLRRRRRKAEQSFTGDPDTAPESQE